MRFIAKVIRGAAAATLLMTATAPRVAAQNDDDDDKRRACRNAVGRERKRCESEAEAPVSSANVPDDPERRETRLRVEQISEDLSFLQAVTDHLSRAASRSGELDFKAIVKSASEVRKRAGRLKDGLALPEPREGFKQREGKVPAGPRELRAALSSLSSLISDAVRNPALRGYSLDIKRSFEARSELEQIIELSERVKAGSETLGKTKP